MSSSLQAYPKKSSVETIIFIFFVEIYSNGFLAFPFFASTGPLKLERWQKTLKQKDRIISMPDPNSIDIKITQNNVLKIQFMTILLKTFSSLDAARFSFSHEPHSIDDGAN